MKDNAAVSPLLPAPLFGRQSMYVLLYFDVIIYGKG